MLNGNGPSFNFAKTDTCFFKKKFKKRWLKYYTLVINFQIVLKVKKLHNFKVMWYRFGFWLHTPVIGNLSLSFYANVYISGICIWVFNLFQMVTPPTMANRLEASPLGGSSAPSMVPPPVGIPTSNSPGPPSALPRHMSQMPVVDVVGDGKPPLQRQSSTTTSDGSHNHVQQPLAVDTNHNGPVGEGPPTPTHSETPDCAKGKCFLFKMHT